MNVYTYFMFKSCALHNYRIFFFIIIIKIENLQSVTHVQ